MKKKGPPPDEFMFVNYDARAKAQGPKAPQQSQSSIRAHLARQHHRKVRRQRMAASSNSSSNNSAESRVVDPATMAVSVRIPKAKRITPTQNSRQSQRADSGAEEDFYDQDVANNPQSMLGQGRLDPFEVFPANNVSLLVHKLLDHGINHYWVELSEIREQGTLNPILQSWMIAARNSPVAFYSFLYAISNHYDFVRNAWGSSSSTDLMRLSYKTQTIKLVNEMLNNSDKGIPDELIAAVLVLATQDSRFESSEVSRFKSPLATAQCLDLQGRLSSEPEHTRGLVTLVRLKGGLQNIKMKRLSDVIAFSDILRASLSLDKPYFPLRSAPVSLTASGKHKLDEIGMGLAQQLGSGFRQLCLLCPIDEVWKVIEAMCEVTVALDHHHRGGPLAPAMTDILVARNITQHRLLSLPECPLTSPSKANYMYEICRAAALTYSNIVIFPLPPESGVHTKLAFRLRQLLTYAMPSYPDAQLHVILWAVTLGGISTGSSSDRIWFLYKLAEISKKLGLYQWSQIQTRLSSLLWLEFVCEKEGMQLWLEARELINHHYKVVYPKSSV